MNCSLCQQYLKDYLESSWIYCDECVKYPHIKYVAHSGEIVVIGFTMNEENLCWQLFPDRSILRKVAQNNKSYEDMLHLPFSITFNPINILDRTKTYLVFS